MLAYLDCFSGISGDMLLGALLDAGLARETLAARLAALPLDGYTLTVERLTSHGIHGTRAHVALDGTVAQPHRRLADIERLLDASHLTPTARERCRAIFQRLAQAEATVHGTSRSEVTFHEVGAVDSVVDIVGVVLGLELLGVETLYASALPLTSGRVHAAHGALPVPAPATLELLRASGALWRAVPAEGELVTPTGAAVLAALARFELPDLRVRAVGYGFGTRQLPWANCLRLVLGDAPSPEHDVVPSVAQGFIQDEVVVIESQVDTMTGEALGWLLERLLASGALDAAYAPLQMKKSRPGVLVSVLAQPDDAPRLAALVVRESGTLGVRMHHAQRLKADRREEEIETPLGRARVKLKLIGGEVTDVAPEYEDCRALALALGLPFETVRERVRQAGWAYVGVPAPDSPPETP